MAGKKPTTRRRRRPSKACTAGTASDYELVGISSNLLKDLSSAVEKRNKDKWQRLRVQYKSQVKKTEEVIRSMAHSNKLS
ncbi:hypothetical protein ACJ73_10305, partial [Blastomyces percursus]